MVNFPLGGCSNGTAQSWISVTLPPQIILKEGDAHSCNGEILTADRESS